jgi:hypothetical protein
MLNVQFLNFRCFTRSASVEIRPITLLIGENSTGKSSFLAGLRFIFEAFSGGTQNIFNKEPFFLGGFEEIAYRKGARQLASQFEMKVNNPDDKTTHQFKFIKGEPQPELSEYKFMWSDHDSVSFSLADDKPTVTFEFTDIANSVVPIDLFDNERGFPPSGFLRANLTYLPMLIQQTRFRAKTISQSTTGRNIPKLPEERITNLEEKFHKSMQHLQKNVFASAPVRTQPSRTYTPSEVRASSEGDQVPLELARAKLRSPEQWREIQRNLASFGHDSGLFTDIDIRQFGKSDIDPFQVLVRLGKDRRNLVDVGYGISQILPIIYPIQMLGRFNAFLLQQPEVHLHSRAQAELGTLIAGKIHRNKQRPTMFVVETHSDYIIDRLRILIMTQVIDPKDVIIVFFERHEHDCTTTNLSLDKNGEIMGVPEHFRDFSIQEHSRLLGL